MELQAQARLICERLEGVYPNALCSLVYTHPYELMIAARLSAQCTDARVNLVTKELFQKYPTLESFATANLEELSADIRPCGFYRTKAESIILATQRLLEVYGGVIPDSLEELLTLSGIGRKTANLLLGDIYGKPAVVTDTHCIRISGRLGLTKNTTPQKVEEDLWRILPLEKSSDYCHRTVLFGRDTCKARRPRCLTCPLEDLCPSKGIGA